MACACNGAKATAAASEPEFEVRLPDGRVEVVRGEHAAKVKVTIAGGGTYSRR